MKDSEFMMKGLLIRDEAKEDIKEKIERDGLVCSCGEKVYDVEKGAVEEQPNYNELF